MRGSEEELVGYEGQDSLRFSLMELSQQLVPLMTQDQQCHNELMEVMKGIKESQY